MRFLVVIVLLVSNSAFSQGIKDYLSEKASNAILITDKTEFIIESADKAVTKRNYEAIIKNSYAKNLKNIYIYYDQFQEVSNAEVLILDMVGQVQEKFRLKDFNDIALGLSNTASDGRLKLLEPSYSHYPFRIKVNYEVEKSGSLHYPVWEPQPGEKMRILSAEFSVIDKSGGSFRYDEVNVPEVEVKNVDGARSYTWKLDSIAPYQFEKYNHNKEDYAPIVYTAPIAFEVEGYKGNMSSWESFGRWAHQLNKDKNDLNQLELTTLDSLINKASSEKEKVAIIYDYLQTNTRYVSIQLGIGGWQPFSASYVQQNKYGDCKALSFFTKSLLGRYGIKSHYTLIRAGGNAPDMKQDFPNAHFNHAIVTVPFESDTTFLECTSQTNPFGYLGTFTSNRNALMITNDGGKLIRTRKYTPKENHQKTKVNIILNENGKADIELRRIFRGLEIDNHGFSRLYQKEVDEREEWVTDNFKWGTVKSNSFDLTELKEGELPVAGFKVSLVSNKEAKILGNRFFISPGKFTNSYLRKLPNTDRKKPLRIRYGYSQTDTLTYTLPEALVIEKGIKPVELTTEFGQYFLEVRKINQKLIYTRKFILNDGIYPPEKYEAFKNFVNQVIKHDKDRLVLLNKT